MQDESFRDWVQGQSHRETFWLSFPKKFPGQVEAMQQAERIVRAMHVPREVLTEKEIRMEVQAFLIKAGENELPRTEAQQPVAASPFFRLLNSRWAAVAAMLVAVVGVAWYVWPSVSAPDSTAFVAETANKGLVQTRNPTRQPLRISLSDSTEVVLSPKSSLSYPSQFTESSREVYLTGEASFSVTHRGQPFIVHSGEMVTRVLGTKFVISAYQNDKKFTVQVLSGKVSVYRAEAGEMTDNKEAMGLILTANQAAIFEKDLRHLTKTLVANPTVVSKALPDTEARYDEVALPAILLDLERSYGIAIQYDEQSLSPCKVTATLGSESLYEKLDMLCKTVSARYQIVDGQIIISGKGCL